MKKVAYAGLIFAAASGCANAQSNVTLYGVVNGGVRWVNGVNGGSAVKYAPTLDPNRLGLVGAEDIGDGVKIIFRLESQFSSSNGALSTNNTLWSREAIVGLDGRFGHLTMGRQFSAAEDVAIALDPLQVEATDPALTPTALLGANFFTLDTRFNNSVKYRARWHGFEAGASYSFGNVAGSQRAGASYSVETSYRSGIFKGGIAYQRVYNADASQVAQDYYAGTAWQFGPAELFLSYLELSVSGTAKAPSQRRDDVPQGGIKWQFTPALSVTAAYYDDIASNLGNVHGATGHKQTAYLAVRYLLSRRTEVYAEVDRNQFSGKYVNDPVNLAAFGRTAHSSGVTGAAVGLITRF